MAAELTMHFVDLLARLLQIVQGAAHMGGKNLAGGGQAHAAR